MERTALSRTIVGMVTAMFLGVSGAAAAERIVLGEEFTATW